MQVGLETRCFPDKKNYTPTMVTVMICTSNPFIHRDPRFRNDRAKVHSSSILPCPELPGTCLPVIRPLLGKHSSHHPDWRQGLE